MTRDLTGKIFHFKPCKDRFHFGERNAPPKAEHLQPIPPEPDESKGGRRSNRLFALHPVVVLKNVKREDIEGVSPQKEELQKETEEEGRKTDKEGKETEKGEKEDEHNSEDVRAGGHHHNPGAAGDNTFGRDGTSRLTAQLRVQTALPIPPKTPRSTPVSSPATSPTTESTSKRGVHNGARRPSLERRDVEEHITPANPVMICNITSQVHEAINNKNYLPIAAPGREYSDHHQKRLFLSPKPSPNGTPSTSPDEHREKHAEIFNARSDAGYSTDGTEYSSCSHMEPELRRELVEKALSMRKGEDGIDGSEKVVAKEPSFLSNCPNGSKTDVAPYSPPEEGFGKSSDQLWAEQISTIDALMDNYVPMPRKDSFVRLDSRTTVDVTELSAFLRPSGDQYELHPASRDLLWQAVLECERNYKLPHEWLLDDIQENTVAQVQNAVKKKAIEDVSNLKLYTSNRLKQQIKWPREQNLVDKILEEQNEHILKLMHDTRIAEQEALKDAYDKLHCRMALVPTQEKPFHPDQTLGKMMIEHRDRAERGEGEGEASLNKPIKSSLALKAIREGKPLPNKREEAKGKRKSVAFARPCRANSNPEEVRSRPPVPTATHHPLASKHSKSSGAIAAQSERPKATLNKKSFAAPRINDKNWSEARDCRGDTTKGRQQEEIEKVQGRKVLEMKPTSLKEKPHAVSNFKPKPAPPLNAAKDTQIQSTSSRGKQMPTPTPRKTTSITSIDSAPTKAKQTPAPQKAASSISSINPPPTNAEQTPGSQKTASSTPPVQSLRITIPETPETPIPGAFHDKGPSRNAANKDFAGHAKQRQPAGHKSPPKNFKCERGESVQHSYALHSGSSKGSKYRAVESALALQPFRSGSNLQKTPNEFRQRRDSDYGHLEDDEPDHAIKTESCASRVRRPKQDLRRCSHDAPIT